MTPVTITTGGGDSPAYEVLDGNDEVLGYVHGEDPAQAGDEVERAGYCDGRDRVAVRPVRATEWNLANALLDLWNVEGAECHHGHGLEECPHDEEGYGEDEPHPCDHNALRPALRLAGAMVSGRPLEAS